MKKMWWTVLLAGLLLPVAGRAESNVAYSVNAIGVVRFDIPPAGRYALVSLSFKALSGGDLTFNDLFGTNQLRGGSSPQYADKVLLYNASEQRYCKYAFKASDLQFHEVYPVYRWNLAGTNPAMPQGTGFWLQSGVLHTETNTVFISGEVISTNSRVVTLQPGFQILGPPFSEKVDFVAEDLPALGATAGTSPQYADQIMFYANDRYRKYALKEMDGLWHEIYPNYNWMKAGESNIVLEVGVGAWYRSQSSFVWTVGKPYDWP
jgi:hypothetical protein